MRSISRNRSAGVSVVTDDRITIHTGRASVIDPLRPLSALADLSAVPMAPVAVGRLGLSHLREVLGYLESYDSIPASWSPTGRVVLMVQLDHSIDAHLASAPGRRYKNKDLRSRLRRHNVDDRVIDSLDEPLCAVGFDTVDGPVAVPARWDGRAAVVVTETIEHLRPTSLACVTVDRSGARRPDEKFGLMLRGGWTPTTAAGGLTRVRVEPTRATWWDGFESGTVRFDTAAGRAA
ncbi:MAG: hypothetical protein ABIO83_11450 [Ilumatobacteraceae bacterium]